MPPFSAGSDHGDNEPMKKYILPLLYKYKVDILMTGHEHVQQYFVSRYDNGSPPQYQILPENITYECSKEEYVPYNRYSDWVKGQALHEISQGAGGREIMEMCPNKTTQMADLIYGNSQYGFNEIYIESSFIRVDYFSINDALPVYTLKIYDK